jgi:hypothetical protein
MGFRIISLRCSEESNSTEKSVVVPYYGQKEPKTGPKSRKRNGAGRVGFELTICRFLGRVNQRARKGEALPLVTRKTHLVSLKEAVQKGKQFVPQEIKTSRPQLDWDQKLAESRRFNSQ